MAERFEIDWGVSELIRDFATLRDTLGSSSATAGSLSLVGGSLGISDIRGAAEALHRASLSGLGAAAAARYGLPMRPAEIGDATDRGAMLIQALEGLRETARSRGSGAALADARNLNIEDWIGVVHLMDDQWQRLKETAQATAAIYSPDRVAAATLLNSQMTLLDAAIKDIGVSLGSIFIPFLADVAGWLASILRGSPAQGGAGASARAGTDPLAQSMRELNRSINENNQILRSLPGIKGGGTATRAAMPAAFGIGQGQWLQDNLRGLAKKFGGYSIP